MFTDCKALQIKYIENDTSIWLRVQLWKQTDKYVMFLFKAVVPKVGGAEPLQEGHGMN